MQSTRIGAFPAPRGLAWIGLGLVLVLFLTGCASAPTAKNTSALRLDASSAGTATAYEVLTIQPFVLGEKCEKAPPDFGENFAGMLVGTMRSDYAGLFREVRYHKTDRVAREVILEGTIRLYRPGNAELRGLLAGLGSVGFEGDVTLRDPADGRVLWTAPFDKLWAWGGVLGASKTIDHVVGEVSVAITKTVALWKQGNLPKP